MYNSSAILNPELKSVEREQHRIITYHISFRCVALKHTIMALVCHGHCCVDNNPPTKQYLVTGDPVVVLLH